MSFIFPFFPPLDTLVHGEFESIDGLWDINLGVMVLFGDDFGVLMGVLCIYFPVNWLYKLSKCHSYSCLNSFFVIIFLLSVSCL